MRQVVTNQTDMKVAVVLCDADGNLYEAPLATTDTEEIDRNVKIRLKVNRQEFEAQYNGTLPTPTAKNCKLARQTLKYVEYTVGANTYYRLPNPSDDITTLPEGEFSALQIIVPRGTFESVGMMQIAICDLESDTDFEDNTQHVWSKYGETNINVSNI